MRRTLSLLLFCVVNSCSFVSFSQEDTITKNVLKASGCHNLSISFATLTPDYLCDGYRPGRPTEFDYANKGFSGALCISYKYQFSHRAYIGFTETIEQQYGDWLDNEIPGGNVFDLQTTVKGAFVRTCYTTAADFTWDYAAEGVWRVYMVAGAGVTYEFETDQYNPGYYNQGYQNGVNHYGPMRVNNNKAHFNGYYAPLGFSAGGKLCYFFEFGFGYRGVFNTGLSYRFNNSRSTGK